MNLLMLAFIICGFLNLVTKAGWEVKRCWKDNIGHCRKRCFHVERYKLLCMNKLTCCIPIKEDDGYTKTPPRPVPFEEQIIVNTNDWDLFSNSPISWFDDEVTVNPTIPGNLRENSSTALAHSLETTEGTILLGIGWHADGQNATAKTSTKSYPIVGNV
ncbi:beta-defensin 125 [Prionailurus bengalensis]|uniref:beta-defensin 125 n=1 Tax=Prionailurus bengalensis TaxID=37029 RepID=UPI001CA949D4|nr:beta-defensin 125 [Prionailurus bengalensis]